MLEVIRRAHEDWGPYKMAIAFFKEKLRFLESNEESPGNFEEAATTLNGQGMLSSQAGLLIEAIEYCEKALSIQLQLGCDEVHLATARVLLGRCSFSLDIGKSLCSCSVMLSSAYKMSLVKDTRQLPLRIFR
jgi:tetratricopeptide (TPR) repeat protein